MSDNKYITFKREDWRRFCDGMGEDGVHSGGSLGIDINEFAESALEDAVVIRTKDPFAGPALHSYAAGINLYVNLSHVNGEVARHLREVAHYFHERALEADSEQIVKLPD